MDEKRDLPLCFLQAFSLLVPGLTEAFRKTQLTPIELFVLSSIKYFGKPHNDQQIFLGKPMRDILRSSFRASPSQITKRIERLEDRGFLIQVRLSSEDKEKLFGNPDGKKYVMLLSDSGSKKIDEFNGEVNALFSSTTSALSKPSTSPFSPELKNLMEELVKYLSSRYIVEIPEKASLGSKSDSLPLQ